MQTAFQKCHPAVNMLFFLSVLLFGMLFNHPVLLGISFLSALSYSLSLRGRQTLKLAVAFLLPTLLLVTVINAGFAHYGVTPLFFLPGGNAVTLEAVLYGLLTGSMVVTVFLWFTCYNAVVTNDKFLFLFAKRLPTFALLVSMTLRFIPVFARRFREVEQAQKGIGNETDSRLHTAIRNLTVVASWSVENAIETADSMKNRGYGETGRTSYCAYRMHRRDAFLICMILVLDAAMGAFMALKFTQASFNPTIQIAPFSIWTAGAFLCYAALCFMPLILDRTEARRWNRLR